MIREILIRKFEFFSLIFSILVYVTEDRGPMVIVITQVFIILGLYAHTLYLWGFLYTLFMKDPLKQFVFASVSPAWGPWEISLFFPLLPALLLGYVVAPIYCLIANLICWRLSLYVKAKYTLEGQ